MSIRTKTLTIVGATVLIVVALFMILARYTVMGGFSELEEEEMRLDVRRAVHALGSLLSSLESTSGDWAAWDDSYNFVRGLNSDFPANNLLDSTFTNLRLNFMIFLDTSRKPVYAKFFDLREGKQIPPSSDFMDKALSVPDLLRDTRMGECHSGLLMTSSGPVCLVAKHILKSDYSGPIAGTLVIGRYLDALEIKRLSDISQISLAALPLTGEGIPPEIRGARTPSDQGVSVLVKTETGERISGYAVLKDIQGEPGLVFRVQAPRRIYEQGRKTLLYYVLYLAFIGLALIVLVLLFLEKALLAPLGQLSVHAREVAETGDLSKPITVSREDELGVLAHEINTIMGRLREKTSALERVNEELRRDILMRQRAEQDMQRSEEMFRTMLNASKDAMITIDSGGRITIFNPAAEEMFGRSATEMIGQPLDLLMPEAFRENHREHVNAAFAKEGVQRLRGRTVELSALRSDGTVFPIELSLSGGHYGDRSFVLSIIRDISWRKRGQQELQASEERYRNLVEESFDGIFVQKGSRIIFANRRLHEMLGYEQGELEGMEHWRVYHPEYHHITRERAQARMKGEQVTPRYEVRLQRKDGSSFAGEINAKAIIAEGEPGIQVWIRDLTEQKAAERDRKQLEAQIQRGQKMEAIGTLAGGVAHDLNNVLSGLVSYPELLLRDLPEGSSLRRPILTIQKSGEKAAAIVQDLLTLARRGVSVMEVVNLNDLVSEYMRSPEYERMRSFNPQVQVEADLEADLLNIAGSPVHLSKTIMNLVSNAAEAMPRGGRISLSTENRYVDRPVKGYDQVKEGDYVVLTVRDNGVGIPEKDLERIFEPFYTKKVMGRSGTGLGLAVVWGTVKDHRGYIDVRSTQGRETIFRLYFPVTHREVERPDSGVSFQELRGGGESILVVDDVEEQREIALSILTELGYSVTLASSGEEAVEIMKTRGADLLILDMIMDPGMDGLDTYRRILHLHPKQKAIIVSGFSETERVKEAQRLGAGAYVKKPFRLEAIGKAVKMELQRHKP
ncbi:MAG: PAS domain S-box protein [Deltaproteobacteria bacterium]|nr:PAS domain S-box protein [Deltaproteobacteria bacterium]